MFVLSEKHDWTGLDMYGWTNAEGEPIMDGVAYRFEQQLDADSAHEYDYDAWDIRDEPDPLDPSECDHGDGSYPEGAGYECDKCEGLFLGPRMERPDPAGWLTWPVFFVNGWDN